MPEAKDAAGVRFFPPGLPLLTILIGIALERLSPLRFGIADPGAIKYAIGGMIVVVSVLGLGLRSVVLMRRSGQSENPYKPTLSILKEGPYRITRNPMYLQMVLVCIGIAIILWNLWVLLLTPICVLLLTKLVIIPEEKYLVSKFGDAYTAYQKTVRRWI